VSVERLGIVKTEYSINVGETSYVLDNSDIVFLAVKPINYPEVLNFIKDYIKDKIVISMAAGIEINYLEAILGKNKIVRIMPNTPAFVGEGMTAIAFNDYISDNEKEAVRNLISCFGKIEEIEEKSSAKYYELEFNRLVKNYPDEYQSAINLPPMVNVSRVNQEKGIIVFCRADDYYRLRMANFNGEIINSDDWQILKFLECVPNTIGEKFNVQYFEIVEKVKNEFEEEANKREQDKEFIIEPVKKEFKRLIDWLKRKQSKEIKKRLEELLDFVNKKQLNYEQSKTIRKLVRHYRRLFALKSEQVLRDLEKNIYPMLENAPDIIKPIIAQKYAQVIIAEEMR
ncbi:MAG: NAD(P)-binding domain-containing protein, partial [candidate division WOR-3 bacterium]|nr:NAD(P)-binding domain-containing protein [candidate division WOR-3 bacterium]